MSFITVTTSQTAKITLEGYFYDKLSNVVLSANNNTFLPYVCAYRFLTESPRLSSTYLEVSGYPLSSFRINNENYLTIYVENYKNNNALYDIVLMNNAGYSKMSSQGVFISAFVL